MVGSTLDSQSQSRNRVLAIKLNSILEDRKMSAFQNSPSLAVSNQEGMVKRYVHQPLTIDHYGIHAKIQENGKVVITGIPDSKSGEYDEVEIPASLVFKLATLLKDTRTIKFVNMTEAKSLPEVTKDE